MTREEAFRIHQTARKIFLKIEEIFAGHPAIAAGLQKAELQDDIENIILGDETKSGEADFGYSDNFLRNAERKQMGFSDF